MINIDFFFVKAMTSTWIRTLVLSQNSPCATLFQNHCYPIIIFLAIGPKGYTL